VAIAHWLQKYASERPLSLLELQRGLGKPLAEVYLGTLLEEGLELKQQRNFYSLVAALIIQI